jgi:hypothetical protein
LVVTSDRSSLYRPRNVLSYDTDMASNPSPTTVDLSGLPWPVAESIKRLVESLRAAAPGASRPEAAPRSIIGLFAGQGVPTPTLEEFQDARREMGANFPREFPDPVR